MGRTKIGRILDSATTEAKYHPKGLSTQNLHPENNWEHSSKTVKAKVLSVRRETGKKSLSHAIKIFP